MKLSKDWIKGHRSSLEEEEVGGKFHKQALMRARGLPVPPFFCLTTKVFRELLRAEQEKITELIKSISWDSGESVQEASRKIHALISSIAFPPDFLSEIFSAHDAHFEKGALVSVRSSMVASNAAYSEDSKAHAFAGMSESFLYVKRESVPDRIKDCFASGYSPQVLTYRHSQGIDFLDFSVSVGVQKMVFGEKSFVMFTCDPNTLERKTLVVAGLGIGEGVVQERVETDHYFINAKTKRVSRKVVRKDKMLAFNAALGEGLAEEEVPSVLREAPVLSDEELLELHEMGKNVERLFKAPQDIEGCFEKGALFLLQSRPIQFQEQSTIVWTSANVSESFPGTTTPLTFSFAQDFYRIIFTDCYRALGVPEKVIMQNMEHLDHMVGFLKGKVYYNLTSFYRLHSLSPLFPFFKNQWEDMMGFSGSFYIDEDKGHFKNFIKGVYSFFYTFYGLMLISWRYLTNQRDVDRFLKWWEETIKDLRGKDFEGLSAFECMALYRSVWEQVGTRWWITLLNDTHLPTGYHVTELLLKKWIGPDSPGLMSNLLCGGGTFKSVEIMYNGIRLAEKVKADASLSALFLNSTPQAILEALFQKEEFFKFREDLAHHLHYFGDRGLQELKMEEPALRERPEQLIGIIKNYLSQDLTIDKIRADEKARRLEGERELKRRLKLSPVKRLFLKFQLWRLRGFIENRENTRYCRSELFGLSKRLFARIAEHFIKAGLLLKKEDIFFLHVDEIFGAVEGASLTGNLQALVELRKREFEEHKLIELPMDITTNGALFLNSLRTPSTDEDPSALQGLGSSPGIVRGRARVVLDPQSVDRLEEGDILIAKETDPGWLFLMLASKGMVVERGSMLSHTAITGRKFGIPTIVSVPGVTDKIKTGTMIEIDGSSGTIKILEAP